MPSRTKSKSSSRKSTGSSSRKTSASRRKTSGSAPKTSKRSIWKGSITFGLVTIPIGLYTAIEERDVAFHQLSAKDNSRIKYKRVSSKTGREVDYDDIVKGYEYEKGKYVTFTSEELDAIPVPTLRTIDVVNFVDAEEIDPLYFQSGYYVAPEEEGLKAYALLTKALESSGKVAVAKVTLREKERLATLRPKGKVLVLETMNWPDEIREPDFDVLDKMPTVRKQEIDMAESLIKNLSEPFDPTAFTDTYRERLQDVIKAKIKGEEITVEPEVERTEEVTDLMEALRASVEATRAKKKPARKSA